MPATVNRPLVWVAASLLAGTLAASSGIVSGIAIALPLVVVALVIAAARFRDPRIRPFLVAIAFSGVGAACWEFHLAPPYDPLSSYIAEHPDGPITVEGTVRGVQLYLPGNNKIRFTLDVDRRIDDGTATSISGGVVVEWSHFDKNIYPGDYVSVKGTPRVAIAEVNPGVNGYEDYLRNRGIHSAIGAASAYGVERIKDAPLYWPWYLAARIRQVQAQKLARAMPPDVLPFVYAIWLGHQSALTQKEYLEYVWSGTAHILSVSGIHAAIVAFSLNFALRALLIGRRTRAIIVMSAVCAFALVAGANVPALRAAIMVCLYVSADLFEREADTPTALSLAAIIFILWDPRSVFDIGCQLSFASVASILLLTPVFQNWMDEARAKSYKRTSARERTARSPFDAMYRIMRYTLPVSLGAQVLPTPIAAASFHALALVGPLVNLIVIPILGAVLWLCFVTSLLSFVWMPLAQIAGYATWLPITALRFVAHEGASLRPLSTALTTPTAPAWTLYWISAAVIASFPIVAARRRKAVLYAAAIIFLLSAVLWRNRAHEPEVVAIDVGHGDASFLRMPTGETLLIDGGDANDYIDRGRQIVAPFLWARGVTRLDAVMISHNDRDHLGGLPYIVDNFRVNTAILGAVETANPLEQQFLALCRARGTNIVRVKRGDVITLGNVELTVLHPTPDIPPTTLPNNLSVVVRIPFGSKTFLYTGDMEAPVEATLDPALLHADVLKVPHHGADTSSTPAFIDAVAPDYAEISTGSHGRRVMDAPIVQRYKDRGIGVLRTDRLGAIRFTLHDGDLHVESERINRGYPVPSN